DRVVAAAAAVHQAGTDAYGIAAGQVDAAREQVGTFVAQAYEGRGLLAINALLTADSPNSFAQRIGYLTQVAGEQKRALDAVTVARQVARERQVDAERARLTAEQAQQAAAQAEAGSRAAADTAQQAADDVQSLVNQRAQAKTTADAERAAVLAQYEELKQQSARIAALLRSSSGSAQGTVVRPSSGAFFLMPTQGWKSSDFGMRYDP